MHPCSCRIACAQREVSLSRRKARRLAIHTHSRSLLRQTWARLFFLYGPAEGPNRLVSSIARNLAAGKSAACSRGRAVRDFMDVRDAGAALAAIALADVEGAINVGTGQGYPVSAVASSLGELAGRPDLVRIGDLPDRIGEPPFIVASVERLKSEVGFETSRTLKEGLADALAFWNAQIENGRSL